MKRIAVIGKYDTANGVSDGQAVKTHIIARELERHFGRDAVKRIDTYNWKKNPGKLFFRSIAAVRGCDNVIFMTDAGGIKIFPWLLRFANVFGSCRLHYVVVGAWLVHFLEKNPFAAACLKGFHGIYVETGAMKRGLESLGFQNVVLMVNCKPLKILQEKDLVFGSCEPYRLCTFSRVMKEKGVGEAVEAVKAVNLQYGKTVFSLDIYGPVDPGQQEWFDELSAVFPPEIRYCGVIPYDASVETVKSYHAMLFPTAFSTEGIPGTVIDAYASGVPVIASEWENFADCVESGTTGLGYPFLKPEGLREILAEIAEDPGRIHEMKKNCLEKAREYLPETVMDILLKELQ